MIKVEMFIEEDVLQGVVSVTQSVVEQNSTSAEVDMLKGLNGVVQHIQNGALDSMTFRNRAEPTYVVNPNLYKVL